MADSPIVPTSIEAQIIEPLTTVVAVLTLSDKPILPPVGSAAAGGPTTGQLFPVGNR